MIHALRDATDFFFLLPGVALAIMGNVYTFNEGKANWASDCVAR